MIRAVLLDRDGTLIADKPRAADPACVEPMPFAREALEAIRARNARIGVVTNQPSAGASREARSRMARIHRRIEELLGPIDGWFVCTHAPARHCACRKPAPGLILKAGAAFGVTARECAVIGDIGSDIDAAQAAGARSVLVPTPVTLADEVQRAPAVARTILEAVELVFA